MASCQTYLRRNCLDDLAGEKSHMYGTSMLNQVIDINTDISTYELLIINDSIYLLYITCIGKADQRITSKKYDALLQPCVAPYSNCGFKILKYDLMIPLIHALFIFGH